jgi:hypothetical protein
MVMNDAFNREVVETGIYKYLVVRGELGGECWFDTTIVDWSVGGIVNLARERALRELELGGADLQAGFGGELICAGVPDEAPPAAHIAWRMLCLVGMR